MNPEMAAALRAPFDKSEIEYLPKGGRSLAYVGHARVTNRLIEVDPDWTLEPLATNPQTGSPMFEGDEYQRPVGLWVKLTVGGVTRIGYGTTEYHDKGDEHKADPEAIKKILSDALRNAAMRFGVGLDLWTKEVGDDVGANPTSTRPQVVDGGANGNTQPRLGSAATIQPSPASPPDPNNEASLIGRSIGAHEHDNGPDGQYIIKRSAKTNNLYAQCNARDVVVNGETKKYCNAFPPYGALDAWITSLKASDVDENQAAEAIAATEVTLVNHTDEFVNAALDADFSIGRPWVKNLANEQLIALVERIEELGTVGSVTFKRNHYGDREAMSRDQLVQLADTLYVAHMKATKGVTQDEIDHDMSEIPFS